MSDPRLLVPLDTVPETWPMGLPLAPSEHGTMDGLARPVRSDCYRRGRLLVLDLSAPPLDDAGNPTRLDALGWALWVLHNRGMPGGFRAHMVCGWHHAPEDCREWWPETPDDDDDLARRLIVAAALRSGVGL